MYHTILILSIYGNNIVKKMLANCHHMCYYILMELKKQANKRFGIKNLMFGVNLGYVSNATIKGIVNFSLSLNDAKVFNSIEEANKFIIVNELKSHGDDQYITVDLDKELGSNDGTRYN